MSGRRVFYGSDTEWGGKMAIARSYIGREWTRASFGPENDGLSHSDGPHFIAVAAGKYWPCLTRAKRERNGCYEGPARVGPVPESDDPN